MTHEFKAGDIVILNHRNDLGSLLCGVEYTIANIDKDGDIEIHDDVCGRNWLFEPNEVIFVRKPVEDVTEKLTIPSFISSMPIASRTGVFQEADKFAVFAYDAEYYAETEERLQEIMEALLVLYKEG